MTHLVDTKNRDDEIDMFLLGDIQENTEDHDEGNTVINTSMDTFKYFY